MKPDFGATAEDYARHRAGFPDSLFERLAAHGVGRPGQSIVDLGTGTGSLARGFARRGCHVIGIDPAAAMLQAARELDVRAGVSVEYRVARAEDTGLPVAAFDVVAAGQCWHWFDRPRAAAEAARVLKPDGILVIAHFDWIPLAGNMVRATEELIEHHNPDWKLGRGLGMYPPWLRDLGEAGYRSLETFSYDVDAPYTPEAWRGRIRASAGVGGSMTAEQVAEFDKALAELLASRFPGDLLQVPHRVFVVLARAPEQYGKQKSFPSPAP
jgi:SAM-dependent methyltransferase